MELKEFQQSAISTCTDSTKNVSFMLLELVAKVGAFSSKLAKGIRKGKMRIRNNHLEALSELRVENYGTEQDLKMDAGFILRQLSGLCSVMGWDLEEIAQMNLNKVQELTERSRASEGSDARF